MVCMKIIRKNLEKVISLIVSLKNRSNGVGIGSFAARVGGITAPYLIELQEHVTWLPNTVFGIFSKSKAIKCYNF